MRVGNAQLLRRHIANELNVRAPAFAVTACPQLTRMYAAQFSCQLDSNLLFCALNTANRSTIADVRAHYARPDSTPMPDEDSPYLPDLAQFLESAGINHPFTKVRPGPLRHAPLVTVILTRVC